MRNQSAPRRVPPHEPVMPEELLRALKVREDSFICDATLGAGGHAEKILRSTANCTFLGIDLDESALELARSRLTGIPGHGNFFFIKANFSELPAIIRRLNLPGPDFIYFDIGISSMQLSDAERGFSFQNSGPLDMRMDRSQMITAGDILSTFSEKELIKILSEFGEERSSKCIARAIIKRREEKPLETTLELADLVSQCKVSGRRKQGRRNTSKIHPATLTFQALRIAVNREIEILRPALKAAINILTPGGRIAVISFHSLEDRTVKNVFREEASGCLCPPDTPICICNHRATLQILTRKPIVPGPDEIINNPRARSAKLRAAEKLLTGETMR